MSDNIESRLDYYRQHLRDDVLAWWLENAVDREYGGLFTSWNAEGTQMLSTDKYTWSQGRWVWCLATLSALARQGSLPGVPADELLGLAKQSAEFIYRSVMLPDGTCSNFVTREGTPTLGFSGPQLHSSIYGDLFVACGFARLSRELASEVWAQRAEAILTASAASIADGSAPTEPYPVPDGLIGFGPRMILLNAAAEVYRASGSAASARIATAAIVEMRDRFFEGGIDTGELKSLVDGRENALEARHRNPGHVIESLWFMLDAAEAVPAVRAAVGDGLEAWLLDIFESEFARGWDAEFGGIFRFVDREGGEPQGESTGSAYERAVLATWDRKLWWPHNEAHYAALMLFNRTGDERAREWFRQLDEYSFAHFPVGPGREWHRILTREGAPLDLDPEAMLPVKDPFHIVRALALLVNVSDASSEVERPAGR